MPPQRRGSRYAVSMLSLRGTGTGVPGSAALRQRAQCASLGPGVVPTDQALLNWLVDKNGWKFVLASERLLAMYKSSWRSPCRSGTGSGSAQG